MSLPVVAKIPLTCKIVERYHQYAELSRIESSQHHSELARVTTRVHSPHVQYLAIEVNRSTSFEERVELYEEICAELVETKRKLEITDENFRVIEQDNMGEYICNACKPHLVIISDLALRRSVEGMRDKLPGPELELRHRKALQERDTALTTVKSERNHYRSKVKSLTREYYRESAAVQASHCTIISLRNEILALKERLAVRMCSFIFLKPCP